MLGQSRAPPFLLLAPPMLRCHLATSFASPSVWRVRALRPLSSAPLAPRARRRQPLIQLPARGREQASTSTLLPSSALGRAKEFGSARAGQANKFTAIGWGGFKRCARIRTFQLGYANKSTPVGFEPTRGDPIAPLWCMVSNLRCEQKNRKACESATARSVP